MVFESIPLYFKMVIAVKFVTWDNIIWVKKRKKGHFENGSSSFFFI